MKAYEKKKAYRRALKDAARKGLINAADGRMIPRGSAPDNSMRRDYYPQSQT